MNSKAMILLIPVFVFFLISIFMPDETPNKRELSEHLSMMRLDMKAIVGVGGDIANFDDNKKPTNSKVYILVDFYPGFWSGDVSARYIAAFHRQGWQSVKYKNDGWYFCKQGAYAALLPPSNEKTGQSVYMEFDGPSIINCREMKK